MLIKAGRVRVNGAVVRVPGKWVKPGLDRITVDGASVRPAEPLYLALHKPRGLVTTKRDEKGRDTVYSCLGDVGRWVFPVGRLDRDTSGLLLFTNDTAFSEAVTSPESKLPKTYMAKVCGQPSEEAIARLRAGVVLDDGVPTLPAEVRCDRATDKTTWLEITIVEGRNRQIRRMCEAVGHPVERLVRTRIGALALGDLAPGASRSLTPSEVRRLLRRRK